MNDVTKVELDPRLETPILVMPCPADLNDFAEPDRQREMREFYAKPGIIVIDQVIGEPVLTGLREGLSDYRRKFKEKFNFGRPDTESFRSAYDQAIKRMTDLTIALFGYDLKDGGTMSYRPLITADEPLHYDTYDVPCGQMSLMSVLNFDHRPRKWNVGPSFREICRDSAPDLEEILKKKKPGESPSVPIRTAGLKGFGPLKDGTPLHRIEFAPGAVWYANPKAISHQITYGGGAHFQQWNIDVSDCGCQSCIFEAFEVNVPNLRTPAPASAA
ncbi:hypothetical protein G7077_03245 [Sphingomonas piscis]|uniref:Uncharacterized protein n=1 Tax=Sphingomonas piscis TaxID=2714943 RepID=A0A6G7YMV4_9SPHN|nr:hypothetical protein [Sphingomonas piscis]QIK78073.1 hypothetical protein G7077_03245 [Sphingomonas piscis]